MKDRDDDRVGDLGDLAGRIRYLEQFTGSLVAREPRSGTDAQVISLHDAPTHRVPAPRRARIFLRHGEGHGTFADVTITAPRPRAASD
ncbi:hypothetical protein [Nocardioides renjunii]|uniref:hypothetical protein n=1 Tax=Nocardioides renjunii TaxID=3095075 RepID=UPI002B0018BF|nr:hypothetical protein [Nocardioides sp. S-34]WQQ22088.1 hypothetical protein SHK17_19645 [Nocardioides sp. S-34]